MEQLGKYNIWRQLEEKKTTLHFLFYLFFLNSRKTKVEQSTNVGDGLTI